MELSQHERLALRRIERQMCQEDPDFAASLAALRVPRRVVSGLHLLIAVSVLLVGTIAAGVGILVFGRVTDHAGLVIAGALAAVGSPALVTVLLAWRYRAGFRGRRVA